MPDISKLGLPEDVKPYWTDDGEPWCPRGEENECPSIERRGGVRCMKTGAIEPATCPPAVEAMARSIPGFLAPHRCPGCGGMIAPATHCGECS